MTLLYLADTRFPIERANGTQTMATCHALAGRGHDVTLMVRPDTVEPARDPFAFYGLPPEPRLRIHSVPAAGATHVRRARYLIAAARLAANSDGLVFTRDLGLAAFLLQFPRNRRPRVIYEAHGVASVVSEEMPRLLGRPNLAPSRAKVWRLERRDRRVWQRAAAYVTITQALADDLRGRFGSRPHLFVVPDGATLNVEADRPAPAAVAGELVVGYAGHLYPWKGVDVLVRALALVPAVRAIIVGGHPKESDFARVATLVRDLGLADRVEMPGLVPPTDVTRHLRRANALVLPNTTSAISDRYTSPLKLFEYLAMGRAIIASDLPSLREVLTDGQTAMLVTPDDPAALAAAISRLAADPRLALALATAGRALAPSYTWHARAARLDAALAAASA